MAQQKSVEWLEQINQDNPMTRGSTALVRITPSQTAVEWLIEQLRSLSHSLEAHLGMGDIRVTQGMIDDLEEKAKQMEKEQLENARPQIISNCVIKEISDKEIDKIAKEYVLYNESKRNWVVEGMKLYREQLKLK